MGDEDRAGELFGGALVDAREAGLGELEIVALAQLAEWHLRGHRLPEAQGHARDAVELAERAELRLRWADALNVLSRVERAAGDTEAAAQAARDAYLQAWCDGPPFSYAPAWMRREPTSARWALRSRVVLDSSRASHFPRCSSSRPRVLRVDLSTAHC